MMQLDSGMSTEKIALHGSRTGPARELLLLAYWYPPENESGALRPYRFSKYLPRFGYRTTVVAAPCAAADATSADVRRVPAERSSERSRSALIPIGRLLQRLAPYNDRLDWVAHATAAAERLIVERDIRLILSTSPPIATHLAALLLKRRHSCGWIADFRDPLAGNPFRTRRFAARYDRLIERMVVDRADAVIVNTDAALALYSERYPHHRAKFNLLWNSFDPDDDFSACPIPPRRHRVLAHIGTIYGGRHPGIVLDSLARLAAARAVDPAAIRLRLVGSIEEGEPWLDRDSWKALSGLGCIESTDGVIPRAEARREMAEADYLLLLDINQQATALQVPAKIFEYVRVGRPILALTSRGSPVERILTRAGVGFVCMHPDDPAAEVDAKLLRFLSLSTAPAAPSMWFGESFDASIQTRALAEVFDRVIDRRRAEVSTERIGVEGSAR